MRRQIEKNKEILCDEIEKLSEQKMNESRATKLSIYHGAYKALCMIEMIRHTGNTMPADTGRTIDYPSFDREMAEEWATHMENEDGTVGPHWSLDKITQELNQREIKCDPIKFWAVINSIYSDDVAVAKKHSVNTMDYYIDRAKAWLDDKDAVKDKAAAYYQYVVKH